MADIESVRGWAIERCRPLAFGLMQTRAERGAAYAALWHALRIRPYIDADGHKRGYVISDEASMYFYRWAFRLPDAFDIAKVIALANVGGGVELAEGIRHFTCMMIDGHHGRPRSRGRARDWLRDRLLLKVLEELVTKFGVRPTRNDASDHNESACDLVSEALANGGHEVSYRVLKQIWFDKALRDEIALIQQLHASRDEAEQARFVRENLPPFPVSN